MTEKEYDKIPGTIVFDADKSREGYHLNQFCISLRLQENRDAFNKNEEAYLDAYPMSKEQRKAVLKRFVRHQRTFVRGACAQSCLEKASMCAWEVPWRD